MVAARPPWAILKWASPVKIIADPGRAHDTDSTHTRIGRLCVRRKWVLWEEAVEMLLRKDGRCATVGYVPPISYSVAGLEAALAALVVEPDGEGLNVLLAAVGTHDEVADPGPAE